MSYKLDQDKDIGLLQVFTLSYFAFHINVLCKTLLSCNYERKKAIGKEVLTLISYVKVTSN